MSGGAARAFPAQEEEDSDMVIRKYDDDPRLRRLAENRKYNREELRSNHRRLRIREAEIVSTIEEKAKESLDAEEDNDNDAEDALLDEKRRKRRKQEEEEEEEAQLLPSEEEDEEEGLIEYVTDSDQEEELTAGIAMLKRVFVPKSERHTVAERERIEAEQRAIEELRKKKLEERKIETKQIVVEEIRKDEEIHKSLEKEAYNIADIVVDSGDEIDEAEGYEAWKARERARTKRDGSKEDREAMLKKEKEEFDTDMREEEEERREWERKNPRKWRFMQKYYHKGAFFQQNPNDEIFSRDLISAPTGEDKRNNSNLPKVMQVKNFGRSGRTKWTHLVNEDTTDWNNM